MDATLSLRVGLLLRGLRHGNPKEKCDAAEELGRVGAGVEGVEAALIAALDDDAYYCTKEELTSFDELVGSFVSGEATTYHYVSEYAILAFARCCPGVDRTTLLPAIRRLRSKPKVESSGMHLDENYTSQVDLSGVAPESGGGVSP